MNSSVESGKLFYEIYMKSFKKITFLQLIEYTTLTF